jgi:hypothetical protein
MVGSCRTSAHGISAAVTFVQYDGTPEGNIFFSMVVQLSESTDIFGIAVKYLQFFAPHFKCTFENIRNELTQLPTQDFSWEPSFYSYLKEHWDKLTRLICPWIRPDPFCCKQHGQHEVRRFSSLDMAGLSDVLPEQVVHLNLHCHVSLSVYSEQYNSLSEDLMSQQIGVLR